MEEAKLRESHEIVEVQIGPIRLIGQMEMPQINEDKEHQFFLKDVGVIALMRGQRPGPIQGTIQEVKVIQVATLDFARRPIDQVWVRRYDFLLKRSELDTEGQEDMTKLYLGFLARRPSIVEHVRREGEAP